MPSFMDKLRGSVDQGVAFIGAKSKELLEVTQIRNAIRQMEQERAAQVQRLGESVYHLIKDGAFDPSTVAPLVESIDAVAVRITDAHDRITRMQEATRKTIEAARAFTEEAFASCTCGAPLRETSLFCPQCGRDVTQIVATQRRAAPAAPFACSRCGRSVPPGSRFCPSCGAHRASRPTPPPPSALP